MDATDYKHVYQKALSELSDLMEKREVLEIDLEQLDSRIGEVRQGITALLPLAKENPYSARPDLFPELDSIAPDLGLTDAIRRVLSLSAPNYISPVGVRAGLEATGYEIKSKNILPSIHTILKRLDGKDVISKDVDGRTWYRWNLPSRGKPQPAWFGKIDIRQMIEEMAKKIDEAEPSKPQIGPPKRLLPQPSTMNLVDVFSGAGSIEVKNPPYAPLPKPTRRQIRLGKAKVSPERKERMAEIDRELRAKIASEKDEKRD